MRICRGVVAMSVCALLLPLAVGCGVSVSVPDGGRTIRPGFGGSPSDSAPDSSAASASSGASGSPGDSDSDASSWSYGESSPSSYASSFASSFGDPAKNADTGCTDAIREVEAASDGGGSGTHVLTAIAPRLRDDAQRAPNARAEHAITLVAADYAAPVRPGGRVTRDADAMVDACR